MAGLALGIDAGGTRTRWALLDASAVLVAEGSVAGLSALQMASEAGRDAVHALFAELCQQVLVAGQPQCVCAGLTGFGVAEGSTEPPLPAVWLGRLLGLAPQAVRLHNDIEIAYLDAFVPGQGYLVYAGTGSIAALIDADGGFHRAGGRGVMLDDGGGGFWIAREAMRLIWRREDEAPGAWQQSALARAVFEHVGGSDWSVSRQFMYTQERGAIGRLALAVAAAARQGDAEALAILEQAGRELARIALALVTRYGARPIVLAGRAATLHAAIADAMRAALPASLTLQQKTTEAHLAAARLALHTSH
ncbi:MAG: N-acetylglucosamine kinase [Sphingomonadaceae bacterium]